MFKKILGSLALLAGLVLCSAPANAGALDGPQGGFSHVNAGDSKTYVFVFRGDELALISVSGDGDTDLDCYLYDQNGREVDRDDDNTDQCRLSVRPRWTGVFRLIIRNRGSVYNDFEIVTN